MFPNPLNLTYREFLEKCVPHTIHKFKITAEKNFRLKIKYTDKDYFDGTFLSLIFSGEKHH